MRRIYYFLMISGLSIIMFQACSEDKVLSQLPSIITATISDITDESATAGGKIENSGSSTITETGICWTTNPNPTVADNKIIATQNSESFSVSITGLKSGITYFVRAYATTSDGTGYGDLRSFTTDGNLALTLPFMERFNKGIFPPQYWKLIDHDGDGNQWYAYNSRFIGAMSDSEDDDGNGLLPYNFLISPKITISGTNPTLEWNIGSAASPSYVYEHYKVVVSTTAFTEANCETNGDVVKEETLGPETSRTLVNRSVDLSNYAGKDVYIAWVHYDTDDMYALLLADVRIGSTENPAPVTAPVIGDLSVGDVVPGAVAVSSIITDDGGVSVVERGFCYSKSPNPTIENTVVDVASDVSNVFVSFSAGLRLEPAATYYVRAFAKNALGVTYSNEQTVPVPDGNMVLLDESFATDPFDRGWTSIDKDGDGNSWNYYAATPSIISNSYLNGPLFPENYLISPAIDVPADIQYITLEFQVASGSNLDYREHYKVIVSENEITSDNCRNADILQDWTELTIDNINKKFTDVSVDMSNYKGKTVYIGIVHGDCTDQYFIMVRKLTVYAHNS